MSFLKLLSVLAVAVLVTAQHPPEGPSFDLNRHMQCRGCVLQGLQWCAKSSASDYDGSCIKITEHCESGAVATTQAAGCPNDTPASKRSCSLCVFDAYSWCQDRRFPRDEYAGHCVAAPNMSTPGQQQAPTSNPNEHANPAAGQKGPEGHNSEEGDDGNNELDSAICGEGARLILRPQACATALNPPRHPDDDDDHDHDHDGDHDGPQQDKKHRWAHAKGAMIAFGIFKVALIVTCLCCCCRKKCRQRCRERCHRWHHHYHGLPEQQVNSTVANPNGSAVALNGGCSFVGGSEDQQVQQAMAASLKPQATIASAPAPVNVMVNIPASTDRKDRNGVEMMHHYPGAAYPSLANSAGYMPVQTHPADV